MKKETFASAESIDPRVETAELARRCRSVSVLENVKFQM